MRQSQQSHGRIAAPIRWDAVPSSPSSGHRAYTAATVLTLIAVLAAVGGVAAFGTGPGDDGAPQSALHAAWLVLVLIVSVGSVLAVHEVGHLIAARLSGLRVEAFVLGPLEVRRTSTRYRLGINRNLALAGGAVICAADPSRRRRDRYLRFFAGGPLANLAVGAAALAAFFAFGLQGVGHPTHSLAAVAAAEAVRAIGSLSVLLGVFALLPVRLLGVTSDGAYLRLFASDDLDAQRTSALLAIELADIAGRRPRSWDDSLIERAASADGSAGGNWLIHIFAYRHALDLGRPQEAGAHLARAGRSFDTLGPAARATLALEAAYFEAAFRGDAAAGRRWLRWVGGWALIDPPARHCADVAVAFAEGDERRAQRAMAKARKALRHSRHVGSALARLQELERLETRTTADVRASSAAPRPRTRRPEPRRSQPSMS